MVVEKPANYDQPQTVNDELLIPAQVGQEVQLEPGTDEPINIEMTEDGGAVINPEQEQIETGFDGNLADFMDADVLTNIDSPGPYKKKKKHTDTITNHNKIL